MTWGEFKAALDARGIVDDTTIAFEPDGWGGVDIVIDYGDCELRIDANYPAD